MAYVCGECHEEMSPDATTCPHCGHEGAEFGAASGTFLFIIGGLFCVTVIGIPIGLPLMWWGSRRTNAAKNTSPAIEV